MVDIGAINVSDAVTAILTLVVAVGGVIGKRYITKALEGIAAISDLLVGVGQLLLTISTAGRDGVLTEDEWKQIKAEAGKLQDIILGIAGRFGDMFRA